MMYDSKFQCKFCQMRAPSSLTGTSSKNSNLKGYGHSYKKNAVTEFLT